MMFKIFNTIRVPFGFGFVVYGLLLLAKLIDYPEYNLNGGYYNVHWFMMILIGILFLNIRYKLDQLKNKNNFQLAFIILLIYNSFFHRNMYFPPNLQIFPLAYLLSHTIGFLIPAALTSGIIFLFTNKRFSKMIVWIILFVLFFHYGYNI